MELLRSWGLEERCAAAAVDVEWQALRRATLAEAAAGAPIEVGYPTRAQSAVVSPTRPACIPQDELEPILQEYLASLPAARLGAASRSLGLDSRDDGALATVRDGERQSTHARPLRGRRGRRAQHGARRARHRRARPRPPRHQHGASASGRRCGMSSASTATSSTSAVERRPRCPSATATAGSRAPLGSRARAARRPDAARPSRREIRLATGVPGLEPRIEDVSPPTTRVALADRFRERSAFLVGDAAHRLTPARRNRDEHRDPRRPRPRLEARPGCCAAGPPTRCSTATRPSGGRSPSTTPRARRTRTARSAARPRSCEPTSAAASRTPGCPGSRGARRRSTCSPTA